MSTHEIGDVKSVMPEAVAVPAYGLKVKLNHVYPEKISPNFMPSWRIIWNMLPLILRQV